MFCSLPQSGHLMVKNLPLGLGISDISRLHELEFLRPVAFSVMSLLALSTSIAHIHSLGGLLPVLVDRSGRPTISCGDPSKASLTSPELASGFCLHPFYVKLGMVPAEWAIAFYDTRHLHNWPRKPVQCPNWYLGFRFVKVLCGFQLSHTWSFFSRKIETKYWLNLA